MLVFVAIAAAIGGLWALAIARMARQAARDRDSGIAVVGNAFVDFVKSLTE
jgi:hypothetical protein